VSALGEALKGIKQLLLIQKQVEDLEQATEVQASALRDLGRDVIAIDRRVARIEGVMEGYGRATAQAAPRSRQKRLPKE
jgi:hypothetical protein